MLRLFVALYLLCYFTQAQVPFPNKCPDVKLMDVFDLDKYMGIWYEYSKYPFIFEIGKKCMFATYENIGNNTVSVENSALNIFNDAHSSIKGKAFVLGPGQLAVQFSSRQNPTKANYLVLGTDYKSFAVVYSCTQLTHIAHAKIVWILTRKSHPREEVIKKAKEIIDGNDLSEAFLIQTIQDDSCPKIGDDDDDDDDDDNDASNDNDNKSDNDNDNKIWDGKNSTLAKLVLGAHQNTENEIGTAHVSDTIEV